MKNITSFAVTKLPHRHVQSDDTEYVAFDLLGSELHLAALMLLTVNEFTSFERCKVSLVHSKAFSVTAFLIDVCLMAYLEVHVAVCLDR